MANRKGEMRELEREPTLAHLAHYAAVPFIPAHGMEHRGELWGRAAEGVTQGSPEVGPLFAVAVQQHLVELDRTLGEHGGLARAG